MKIYIQTIFSRKLLIILLSIALISCSGSGSENGEVTGGPQNNSETDPRSGSSDELFDPNTIVEINIRMASADWDFIRTQTRDLEEFLVREYCLPEPFESPFIYRPGSVTVNGVRLDNVGIRKKGFWASLDNNKPSLKIKFDKFVDGQEMFGLDRLTLNNNKQDSGNTRQCIAYQLFTEAGVPAPRCNFAHVTVNDRDLGFFTHVESIKKRFLARHFNDNDGNLYEGTLSDFTTNWGATFEIKTNKDNPDRSDIEALIAALALPDEALEAALSSLMDIDEFMNFWAIENLIGHWDGYTSSRNNFYIYFDPTTDLMHFIPWGADGAFNHGTIFGDSLIYAHAKLPRRLYMLPSTQKKFIAAMQNVIDTVWDEEALIGEIDRMQAMIADYTADSFLNSKNKQVDGEKIEKKESCTNREIDGQGTGTRLLVFAQEPIRDFITGRRAEIESVLNDPPLWDEPDYPPCIWKDGEVKPGDVKTKLEFEAGDTLEKNDAAYNTRINEEWVE